MNISGILLAFVFLVFIGYIFFNIIHPIFKYFTDKISRRIYKYQSHKRWLTTEENNFKNDKRLSGYPIDWSNRKKEIIKKAKKRCSSCGQYIDPEYNELHIHHKISLPKGGDHSLDNLELLCKDCHINKHPNLRKATERRDLYKELGLLSIYGNPKGKLVKKSTVQWKCAICNKTIPIGESYYGNNRSKLCISCSPDRVKKLLKKQGQ